MNIIEWTIWGVGAFTLIIGLILTPQGKVVGRSALLFTICTAIGLAVTAFTSFSKLHLLWILPVALAASGALAAWLALRMLRSGLQKIADNPEFKEALNKVAQEAAKQQDDDDQADVTPPPPELPETPTT